ncbi:hypothetical protein [Halobacillus sp. K22]|uniref:hypothetical protein n=1 Tax=Halobacillus sp. K22 TaxID=3457431 RepID=UPI003FCC70EB
MWKNKNKWKWLGIIAVLLIFAVGTYMTTSDSKDRITYSQKSKPQRKAKPVNQDDLPTKWQEVESYQNINDFYKERVPGLEIAQERGLTTFPQESTKLPELDGRMQINEVWHSGRTIYIFYSIDLSALITEETNNYVNNVPSVEEVKLKKEKGADTQSLSSHAPPMQYGEGVIFENRLYSMVQTIPIPEEGEPDRMMPNPEEFNQQLLTSMTFRINGNMYESKSMPVQYTFDPDKNLLAQYTFDEKYQNDGLTVEPLELNLGITESFLKVRVDHEREQFNSSMNVILKTADGQQIPITPFLQKVKGKEAIYEGYFRPVYSEPDDVSLEVKNVHLTSGDSFSFNVDLSEINPKVRGNTSVNEKAAEIYNTDVYIEQLNTHGEHGIDVQLGFRPQDFEQPKKLIGISPRESGSPAFERPQNVHIESDNGKEADVEYGGSEDSAYINVKHSLVQKASSLDITLKNAVYTKQINQTFEANRK